MKARAPQHVIDALRDLMKTTSMERASFGNSPEESEAVKKAVRLWLETWTREPLRDLLAWAEGRPGRVSGSYCRTPRFERRISQDEKKLE